MTYTTYDTPASILVDAPEVLRAAALAAGGILPVNEKISAGAAQPLSDATTLPGAQAVSVSVTGAASGAVTLLVADDVAAALRTGPLGADELANALTNPIADAVAALEDAFGGALHVGIADAIIAEALDFGAEAVAVPLLDGVTQVALLVVELAGTGPATPPAPGRPTAHEPAAFTALVEEATPSAIRPLDLLHDVEMAVTVELGRTRMAVRDLLSLTPGAVIELDRAAGSPVDVLVNGKLIARGEVVVIDDDFGIRISEIIGLQINPS